MSDIDNRELDRMLQAAFDASTKLYQERGFQRRVGFGKRPALVSVGLFCSTGGSVQFRLPLDDNERASSPSTPHPALPTTGSSCRQP